MPLPWHARRANVCIDGLKFGPGDVGKVLSFGAVWLEVTGPTKPCHRMDEACPGLKDALGRDWRAGVTCRVMIPGVVYIGCEVVYRRRLYV